MMTMMTTTVMPALHAVVRCTYPQTRPAKDQEKYKQGHSQTPATTSIPRSKFLGL
ncbi:hypothetical protein TRIATDRAFT_302142 [Trichoderma atroviride IMI 206040]|uniref:Uncharacterized protein n=1 Tax=Hypocrea atroviridis (strain ATCC 20476 / IMI 206040) TaxID=452589 RepID=G9P876_HYPAI|nr:uncharacterized protein TRIATDRAFT_302142 [Trichoderma atroviride IMI 206040]EHK41709.1 hypothetical protein TRIATDRAFT_302142 [Trichoderma atroviride IMI 206040]